MPTARETLLDSALSALAQRPWSAVRMVEVAQSAGVSRQTLYNEFGSKDGLARALTRREVDTFLTGVDLALAGAERSGADAGDCFAAAAEWTLRNVQSNPLVRSVLTGGREDRLTLVPGTVPLGPTDMVAALRNRAVGALEHGFPTLELAEIGSVCEAAVRLTVSYAVAPAGTMDEACAAVAGLVRGLLWQGWCDDGT
ncbi:TetR family transcriptional regulator [Wenjunlia vitaminophila]|uniref:TetR family transcriptional regulator n=1 Tax=Wenjunlia vitaminophila TaxID=76728 RepID=A0A0T6LMC5_WENVI|nr:TetR/AcrR family transcriptional regulator [Wenjunlia vitaminophila]KRV47211.1 TetR family transcriptional regulator [Wenjunlia vitaminophila]